MKSKIFYIKQIIFLVILFTLNFISYSQTTYKVKSIEALNPQTDKWDDIVGLYQLEITIDAQNNIYFSDYNMYMMELLAGKEYIGLYDKLIFENAGLDKSDREKATDSYKGKLKLVSNNNRNLPQSKEAYVHFIHYPSTGKLGLIQIANYFCMCHLRFYFN